MLNGIQRSPKDTRTNTKHRTWAPPAGIHTKETSTPSHLRTPSSTKQNFLSNSHDSQPIYNNGEITPVLKATSEVENL